MLSTWLSSSGHPRSGEKTSGEGSGTEWIELYEEKNAPIQSKNPAGVVVDTTPVGLTDIHDDNLTWQRIPNGKDTDSLADWKLRTSTKGDRNLE